MARQREQAKIAIESLERLAAWRVYGTFPDAVFRLDGKRVGNQQKRAAFNWARHLPSYIFLVTQLANRADGILGEVSMWLGRSPNNRLTPKDLLHRLRLYFDITGRMDSRLLKLTGHELTVVVAAGLPDAMGIIELFGFYAQAAVPDAGPEPDVSLVLHVELANRGLLDLSDIAVRFASLTEHLDEFVLLAMDLEKRERQPFEGSTALARSFTPSHRLITLFGPLVPIKRLIAHVEWSISDTVANILRGTRKVVGLTNSIKSWRQHNRNKWLPLVL